MRIAPLAAGVTLAVACASSAPPTSTPYTQSQVACASDDDCAVSNIRSCCADCPSEPYADVKGVIEATEQSCKTTQCPRHPPRDCRTPVSLASLHAECRASRCVLASAAACKTNDDCAMSTVRACCQGCGAPPFAELKSEIDSLKGKCTLVECSKSAPSECKPTESIDAYRAECQNAACVAVRNPPQPTANAPALLESAAPCATDADCLVTNTPACCPICPTDAYATSHRAASDRARCAAVDCSMDRSQTCAPAVDASLYRAVCRAHTCAGVKR